MKEKLEELKNLLKEIYALKTASGLLYWDEATYIPEQGKGWRSFQTGVLEKIAHRMFTGSRIGKLLEGLEKYEQSLPPDSDDASLIRVTRKQYLKAIKIPEDFVRRFAEHTSLTYQLWQRAREDNNFKTVKDNLKKTVEMSVELANYFSPYEHILDPLIDYTDPGLSLKAILPVFNKLRDSLPPLIEKTKKLRFEDESLTRKYPEEKQLYFCRKIAEKIGYDFKRGRLDLTHHPFTIMFSWGDVRITTRVRENFLPESIFSTIHEAGHGIYDQGINRSYEGSPLHNGAGFSVHESQSRLWENVVGRSIYFWEYFYPQLKDLFPEQLKDISLRQFYRAINRVMPGRIRTDADELTYNLHIIIRFELEIDLLEGKLEVDDLPQRWAEKYYKYLGVEVKDDKEGVLQDVHWFSGPVGGVFHGYAIGNILSVQFFNSALKEHPEIPVEISKGNFTTLHQWLKENIYKHGKKFSTPDLIKKVSKKEIDGKDFINYLEEKFSKL